MAPNFGEVLLKGGDRDHRRRVRLALGGRRQFRGRRLSIGHAVSRPQALSRPKDLRLEDFRFLFLDRAFGHGSANYSRTSTLHKAAPVPKGVRLPAKSSSPMMLLSR